MVAVDYYPPWTITDTKPYRGIDIEIINKLAQELSLEVSYINCPFKRCLVMLANGQVDLMPGLFKTAEREKYAIFVEPAYFEDPPKEFYINLDKPKKIERYEDLQTLVIGVKRGVSYFDKFDQDKSLNKFTVTEDSQLVELLKIGRIDTFISSRSLADYLISKASVGQRIVRAPFHYGDGDVSYMAISKKSLFSNKVAMFSQQLEAEISKGVYHRIAEKYFAELYSQK
ncbi:transporter substrate-binding domain-containing protein [Thalassotalea sp. G2M2-11]|uniref:substrate-binding periplasmic protein n=1 Tax=Thalassotalea sp. G2M2-11 TaxID=2787627 RepID=UPI001F4952E1|nr:transporter substrate-binding domain-containing protein [Thalassotalea sp. G2M2-11]